MDDIVCNKKATHTRHPRILTRNWSVSDPTPHLPSLTPHLPSRLLPGVGFLTPCSLVVAFFPVIGGYVQVTPLSWRVLPVAVTSVAVTPRN
jgi:hypothetical protein